MARVSMWRRRAFSSLCLENRTAVNSQFFKALKVDMYMIFASPSTALLMCIPVLWHPRYKTFPSSSIMKDLICRS